MSSTAKVIDKQHIEAIYPTLGKTEVSNFYGSGAFNCGSCINTETNCCNGNNDKNSDLHINCIKCRCQNLYGGKSVDPNNNSPHTVELPECKETNCDSNLTKDFCDSHGYLTNTLAPITLKVCSNKITAIGDNQEFNDINQNIDGCGDKNDEVHLHPDYSPEGTNGNFFTKYKIYIIVAVVIFFVFIILILIF